MLLYEGVCHHQLGIVQYHQDVKATKDEEVEKSTAESHSEGSAGGKYKVDCWMEPEYQSEVVGIYLA